MTNFSQIAQLLAQIVSSRLTITMSHRVAQLAQEIQAKPQRGWFDKTSAGRAAAEQRSAASGRTLAEATAQRDSHEASLAAAGQAFVDEQANPTGKDLQELANTALEYRALLRHSMADLRIAQRDHDANVAKQVSVEQVQKTNRIGSQVDSATSKRDQARDRLELSSESLLNANANGTTGKAFQKLSDAVLKYKCEFDEAELTLKLLTQKQEELRKETEKTIEAQKREHEAEKRANRAIEQKVKDSSKSSIGQAARRAVTSIKRRLGPKGRKVLKDAQKRFEKCRDAFNPEKRKQKLETAKERARTADTAHQQSKYKLEHIKSDPSSPAVDIAAGEAEVAATGAEAAEAMAALGVESGGLVAALGPVGVAIGGVATAVVGAVVIIKGAIDYVNKMAAEGVKEVARFRQERQQFDSRIANAIAEYDMQTLDLEKRSSSATGGVNSSVTRSTMELRESKQKRSEDWENIGGILNDMNLQLATGVSNLLSAIDIFTPMAKWSAEMAHWTGESVGLLRKVEENTKGNALGADKLGLFQAIKANKDNAPNKIQNKEIPRLKPVR